VAKSLKKTGQLETVIKVTSGLVIGSVTVQYTACDFNSPLNGRLVYIFIDVASCFY